MPGTCLWRSWMITLEWDADATVPQDVRDRLTAFLEHVLAAIADLAVALTDATDDDLVVVLAPHVLRLPGPSWSRTVEALAAVIPGRYTETTDADRLPVWMAAVDRALEGKDPAVQGAIVAVLLERVLRALLASPTPEDPDALDHAADVLAASMVGVLQEVCSRAIPPQAYHIM